MESLQLAKEFADAFADKVGQDIKILKVVAEALPLCVEFSSVTELRQKVSSVRNRIRALGNVNVAAIEEYQEVSARYQFLSEQISDVDESRKSLLRLIDDLEREMKQIFTRSFNEINEKFHYTFKMLFGGGHANLFLTDENDTTA